MALNREVWIDQVKEGFYPDDRVGGYRPEGFGQ